MDISQMIAELKASIDKFKAAGLSFGSLKSLVGDIVKAVENFNDDNFKGKDKKAAALNLLDQVYDLSGVDIPFVPDSVEHTLLRFVAGTLIDAAVSRFNVLGWK